MCSGIKSWLNISSVVASSPQCVTQAYEIHSLGVRIIMLGDHGRDLSCLLYFWGPKSALTAGSLRRSATASVPHTRLLLQQHPVTGGRVGRVVVASYGRMRHFYDELCRGFCAQLLGERSLQPTITSSSLRPSDA